MRRDTLRQVLVLVATVGTIAMNSLANSLPLNNLTTGEISDRFDVYFVPAGYVFSIWLVIYLWLIAFAIFQALPGERENPYLRRVGYLYVLSCVANVAWLFLWHYEVFALTLVAMLALLLLLMAIYTRLGIGRERVRVIEKGLIHVPFSVYLGWITVATIANVTSLLDYLGWNGWGIAPEMWAVIMLVAGAAIASAVGIIRGDIAYILVIVWAFVGIAAKHPGTAIVANTARVMALLVVLTLVVGVPRMWRRMQPARTRGR